MVQSVELLLDDDSDAAVRAEWELLRAAGLPSQGNHRGETNRPHVTLAALPRIYPASEPLVAAAAGDVLPLDVGLGAVTLFGNDPYVLVRAVVVSRPLLELHERVAEAVGAPAGTNLSPGLWTPHVTLARRIPGDLLPAALALLGTGERTATCVAVRRWDGDARRDWLVATAD